MNASKTKQRNHGNQSRPSRHICTDSHKKPLHSYKYGTCPPPHMSVNKLLCVKAPLHIYPTNHYQLSLSTSQGDEPTADRDTRLETSWIQQPQKQMLSSGLVETKTELKEIQYWTSIRCSLLSLWLWFCLLLIQTKLKNNWELLKNGFGYPLLTHS